jgi:hypothetical protein
MMRMKIASRSFGTKHYVELKDNGIEYCETVAFGGKRFFRFDEIEAVLRGPDLLAFQVGRKTFSIPIDPNNADHRALTVRLATEAKRTVRKS